MAQVYVSIGSNIDKQKNISGCLAALAEHFGALVLSPIYESEAVGFEGDNFYNLVAKLETQLSVGELNEVLKGIEDQYGRKRTGPRFSGRTLDIDILTYDNLIGDIDGVQLPRDEITKNAFVLLPMNDIAADELHPELQVTYGRLWFFFDKESQNLWQVEL
ncbi:MAG: 2-amino-4-hydroxy-6-hydroxymethyldihydropteridine diphosphokinase [Bermanella sp.]|nr:2-amino-4-hydroxy-6-hydroxymethyldihydropteridine diphosphokinase [Bermanella sp.]|tara:strand:- start:391 stop:873 length:483 start_codon:yes stop_codon:yes gene_type:complete